MFPPTQLADMENELLSQTYVLSQASVRMRSFEVYFVELIDDHFHYIFLCKNHKSKRVAVGWYLPYNCR